MDLDLPSSGDYGLRRLFRPPFDHLPESQQLQNYHQRNFIPSHLYRMGVKLFRKEPTVRTRVIDASYWIPKNDQTSAKTNWSSLSSPLKDDFKPASAPTQYTVEEYKNWIAHRQELRKNLEQFGGCEQWLLSKSCTPVEASVLEKLRAQRRESSLTQRTPSSSESISTDDEELSPRELKRVRMKEKKQFMKDVKRMEDFLILSRSRLAGLLIQFDKKRDYLLPLETIQDILGRLRVPVEDHVINVVCDALENHTGINAVIDYRLLLKRGLVDILEQYLTILEQHEESNELFPVDDKETKCLIKIEPISTSSSTSAITQEVLRPTKSTMDGKHGEWSEMFKEDAQKQFMCLIEYCQRQNIILDKASAERALLLPADRTRKQCLSQLRQPGTDVPSIKITELPTEKKQEESNTDLTSIYGWQYKHLRGNRGSKLTKLSTGVARVKAKTDCWMTFRQFQKLTEEIQARPDFNYKYHGLPSNSAFWPGALLDKLRIYLPEESLSTKPYSLYNIFQPVTHPKVYNVFGPVNSTKGAVWPENISGHVQLGASLARTRKSYCL